MSRNSSFSSGSDVNFDDLDDQQVFGFLEDDNDSRPSSPGSRSRSPSADFRLDFSSRISLSRAPPPPLPAAASNKPATRKSMATTKPRSPSLTPKKRIVKRSSLTISTPTSKLFSRTRDSSVQNVFQTSASRGSHSDLFLDLVPAAPMELTPSGDGREDADDRQRTSEIQEAVPAVNSKPRKAKAIESTGGSSSVATLGNTNALVAALASLQTQVELLTSEKSQLEVEAATARTTIENLEQKVAASEQSSDLFARQLANVKESFQAKLMAREEEVSLERMTLVKEKETQLQQQQARFTTEAELWKHEIAALTKVKLELESDNERLSKELSDEALQRDLVEVKQRALKAENTRTTEELQLLLQERDRFEQAQVEIQQLQAQMAENQQDQERQHQELQNRVSQLLLEKDEQVAEWGRERQLCVRRNDQEKAKLLRFVQEVRDLHRLLHVSVTEARELFNVEVKKTKDALGVIQQQASEFAVHQSDREVALMSRKGRILQLETQLKNDRQTINQLETTLAKSTRVLENKFAALRTKFQEQKEHLEITLAVRQGLTTDLHAKRKQVAELEREVVRLNLAKAKAEVKRKHSQQQILAMQKLQARDLDTHKKISTTGSNKVDHTPLLEENNELSPEEPEWREFVELVAAYEAERQLQLNTRLNIKLRWQTLSRCLSSSSSSSSSAFNFLRPSQVPMSDRVSTAAAFCSGLAGGAALLAAVQHLRRRAALESTRPLDVQDPEAIRHPAAALTELMVRYHENLQRRDPQRGEPGSSSYAVRSQVKPGELRGQLPPACPEEPQSYADIFRDVEQLIFPALTHWASPNFHAYFKICGSDPSVLADYLCSSLDVIGFSWIASPAATELEQVVCDWLAKLLGLPDCFLTSSPGGGVIQGSASDSALCALIAARNAALEGLEGAERQEKAAKLVLYVSDQTHAIAEKGCMVLDIAHLRVVPTVRGKADEDNYGLAPDDVARAMAEDRAKGLVPFCLMPTLGTTSTTAIDPLRELVAVAREQPEYVWVHLDGAYGGVATVCPEYQRWLDGVEGCDSVCVNTHKWLLVSFDASLLWVKDRRPLVRALALDPEYLRNDFMQSAPNYKDWQVPLGRRFRALKLWFTFRRFGASGLRAHIRRSVELAQQAEDLLEKDGRFQFFVKARMGLVCFYVAFGGRELNEALLRRVNESGKAFLIHSVVDGVHFLRLAVGGLEVDAWHIQNVVDVLSKALTEVVGENPKWQQLQRDSSALAA